MNTDTSATIRERRAIRRYKPDLVPDDLLREILDEARWAPSATNTQSTYVYALSGEPLRRFKSDLRQYVESEAEPNPDFPRGAAMPATQLARQEELFKTRSSFVAAEEARLGVPQPQAPISPMIAGTEIFGAPSVLVLTFDDGVSDAYGCFDAGLFAMAITLAAHTRGLGTCITGSNVRLPDLLRKIIPGTEKQKFVVAIAIGYPDWDAPVNRFPRTRIPSEEFLRLVR
ncbi:MAG TPA: nitroreductase [Thermoleophilia bacterium]|nr:nitroreductase [Thermoleophilia bacterium]